MTQKHHVEVNIKRRARERRESRDNEKSGEVVQEKFVLTYVLDCQLDNLQEDVLSLNHHEYNKKHPSVIPCESFKVT